ncbi:four F5 protein [Jaminaea rosea]|uniref:Four F5 protein n=1 Tax=Jaminaea rosea TaxID=1569628 RepID=A0A316UVC4_9BASI|nr:four F5 protein [Jaminaea rosea]PWN28738.1 four F5 protein [Jaminaea rosea]
MARGNQRDLAREKANKKAAAAGKGKVKDDGLTVTQRKERDAQAMREKQLKRDAEKAAEAAAGKK